MAEGTLGGTGKPAVSPVPYRLGNVSRLLQLTAVAIAAGILIWELREMFRMRHDTARIGSLFESSPILMFVLTISATAAFLIPIAYVWGYLKEQMIRDKFVGVLERTQRTGRGDAMTITISGMSHRVIYDSLLDLYIEQNALLGETVEIELRGKRRVFSMHKKA